ncbi:MAG: tetratricopeptide repeat protein [Cyclobacteriaceae bacterium]
MNKFIEELKRRNVLKASLSYAIIGWVLLQVGDILFPVIGIEDLGMRILLITLLIGFPIWVVFAYFYESTPEGFKKTEDVEEEKSIHHATSKKLNFYIIGGLVLVVALLVFDRIFQIDVGLETAERDKSVAILPFKNLSASEDVYFAAGMTEDILTQISQIGELRVLSNYTLNDYESEGKSPQIIGEELGVSYILTGNVRRSADDLRISCQLVGTNNEGAIWAKTYDKRMTNMFELQAEIATEIARTLAASLSDEQKEQLEQKPTDNLVAYDLYLQAREVANRFSKKDDLLKQIDLLEEAIELDPTFSLAYSSLAATYIFSIQNTGAFPGNYLDTAFVLAQKGVDLGPDYYQTWGTLGAAYSKLGKREQAATMYKRALEINPNSSSATNNLSNYYLETGKFDKSIEMYKKSIQLKASIDSAGLVITFSNLAQSYRRLMLADRALYCAQEAINYKEYTLSLAALGTTQYISGDTISSSNSIAKMVETDNHSIPSLATATSLFYEYLDQDLGLEYLKELKKKENFRYEDFPYIRTYEAFELQKAGKYDSSEVLLNENLEFYLAQFERGRRFQGWLFDITKIYVALDQEEKAFEWLQKLVDDGFMDYVQVNDSRLFDPLKDQPEYIGIMGGLKERLDAMRQRVIDAEATEQLRGLKM